MPTRSDIQKAMAYDLIRIFKEHPEKAYTIEDPKEIIDAYITGANQ